MDSNSELSAGYRGAFKLTAQISRIFGIFPFIMSPKAKLIHSPWLKFYGIFIVLPYFIGIFIWTSYLRFRQFETFGKYMVLALIDLILVFTILLQVNYAILSSSSRMKAWLICLNTIEKILVRNEVTEKKESMRRKFVIFYMILIHVIIITYSVTLRVLTNTYLILDLWNLLNTSLLSLAANIDTFLFIFLTIRIHSATLLMNEGLKKLLHNMELNKNNKMGMKTILRNNYLNIKSTFKTEDSRNVTQKIRDLALSYMSICEVIRTATDSGEMGITVTIIGNLARLMARSYKFVKTYGGDIPLWINATELLLCANILFMIFLFCEPPHHIHNKMLETQEVLNKLERIYHEEGEVINELNLFSRLTMLNRPTFSPLNIYTLNLGLVATMIGYAATYLIAIIQLEINDQ